MLVLAGLAGSPMAMAFGPTGHRVAGYIASRLLCPQTRVALEPLLHGMTLAEAGLWPDTIRRAPEWAHTRPWHYINVADHGSLERAARRSPDNVLAALARFEAELKDPALGRRQRGIALRFVAHLVVDIHQPLHVGRAGDRGGNLLAVRLAGRESNLHAVWDGELLRLTGAGPPRAAPEAAPKAAPEAAPEQWARSVPLPPPAAMAQWQRASPLAWARESQALRPLVYGFPAAGPTPGSGPVSLSPAYLERARTVVDERLVQAGVRLAGRLNTLFGASAGCGPEVASHRLNL